MRQIILIITIIIPIIGLGQTTTENFVQTHTYRVANGNLLIQPTAGQVATNITYIDGLGRPVQQVAQKQSGTGKDIITHIEYNEFGQQVKEYLPYASTQSNGSYVANAKIGTETFYNTAYYENTLNPYSEKLIELSPLSRVLKQGAPGNAWQLAGSSNNDRSIKMDYQANTAREVRMYKAMAVWNSSQEIYDISLQTDGYYPDYTLYKNIVKDENWTVSLGSNHTTEEFRNQQGQVVLKRTFDADVAHDTYYVYDQFGNLTYVFPPLCEATFNIPDSDILDNLCYQYKYDKRNRLAEKKLPGKQWEYMVYDALDRLIANGPVLAPFFDLQGIETGWLLTRYDELNRVAYTAWQSEPKITSDSRKYLQHLSNNSTIISENRIKGTITINGITFKYSNNFFLRDYHVLTINYYDDYDYTDLNEWVPASFPTSILSTTDFYNNTNKPKGMLTGTWVRVLENSTDYNAERGYLIYDKKGRLIRSFTRNHLYHPGFTQIDSQLDFEGKTLRQQTIHRRNNTDPDLTINEYFDYDAQGRLSKHRHKINSLPEELLVKNEYDDMGQLIVKKVGGSDVSAATYHQKVDYGYNIRGWLKSINNVDEKIISPSTDLFAFKINYNVVQNYSGQTAFGSPFTSEPLYNGNISETYWRSKTDNVVRKYTYNYDALNRLTDAYYLKPKAFIKATNAYNEHLSYDANGNINHLFRTGYQDNNDGNSYEIDDLKYKYSYNLLLEVIDRTNDEAGFKDGNDMQVTGEVDYEYDGFGNMILDRNKEITKIDYNHLNLPSRIIFTNQASESRKITYLYNANGVKVRKIIQAGRNVVGVDYLAGFQYKNNILQFFPTSEGYVNQENNQYNYVYNYTDHLGNTRLSYTFDTNENKLVVLEENNYYPFGLKHQNYNSSVYDYQTNGTSVLLDGVYKNRFQYKYNGKELQDEFGLNVYDYGARVYDPAAPRFWQVDPMADERHWISPYNYVQNNPLLRVDPTGMLDTHYEDEFGNTLADTNDGNNATVVISSENSKAFQDDFNNTSVMHQDGATKNAEWIGKYGEGMIAEEGATVQSWAVEAMGHDTNYEGMAMAGAGLGLAGGEKALKGSTFRLFNNKGTNFSPKLYTSGWKGGSAGRITTYGGASKGLGLAGKLLGWYSVGNSGLDLIQGRTTPVKAGSDIGFGLLGIFGGIKGALISASYEAGKVAGPSRWYGNDDSKWFE